MGEVSPFSAAALEANRRGVLSADQSRHWRRYARRRRVGVLKAAGYIACIAILLFALRAGANSPGEMVLAGAGLAAVAVILVIVAAAMGGGNWALDAAGGVVSVAEGAIHKDPDFDVEVVTQSIHVGALRLNVGQSGWDAAPSAGYVRAFYLPRTKWIVNLERLPDPPLPEGDEAKRALWKDNLGALRSRDLNERGEARASLAALGDAVKAQFPVNPAPPPVARRDPRPLAQAVCGVWSSILMTVEFAADGSLTVTSGHVRRGRWSVNRAGRLVADLGWGQSDAEAWVSGAELVIIAGSGKAVTFTRVAPLGPAHRSCRSSFARLRHQRPAHLAGVRLLAGRPPPLNALERCGSTWSSHVHRVVGSRSDPAPG